MCEVGECCRVKLDISNGVIVARAAGPRSHAVSQQRWVVSHSPLQINRSLCYPAAAGDSGQTRHDLQDVSAPS